jgi:hypothetical protein
MAMFQRVNRSDPERAFIAVLSNETCAADDACIWETASASIDGVKVRQPDTALLHAFVGIADAAITSGQYGLVQVYGYRTTSRVFQTNTSQDTGAALVPTAGAAYMASVATATASNSAVTQQPIFAVLAETIASSSASATISAKLFIRAL